jgi:competence protein ComEC
MYLGLVFGLVSLILDFYHWHKTEILTHEYYQSKIISIKEKGKVLFLMNQKINKEKVVKFIVEPYMISRRIEHFEMKKLPETTKAIRLYGNIYRID